MIQEANISRYNLEGFFAKRPKPASSHLPSVIVADNEETSQKVTKQWTDPVRQKEKERRRHGKRKDGKTNAPTHQNVQNDEENM